MSINREDALAVISSANRLGVDPGVLAGLMELESNMDPNIIGGAGNNYRADSVWSWRTARGWPPRWSDDHHAADALCREVFCSARIHSG